MAKLVNRSARVIHVGDHMLVPGVPTEVSDEAMEMKGFKAFLDAKEVTREGDEPAASEAEGESEQSGKSARNVGLSAPATKK